MAIDTPSSSYVKAQAKRELPNALYGGTQTMRDAGETYLPKEPGELTGMYAGRLKRSFLKNYLKNAIQGTRAKIFAKPVVVEDFIRPDLLEDIDMQGTSLTTFCADLYTSGVRDGLSFVLGDAPAINPDASQAEFIDKNIRPYFTVITAPQLIDAQVFKVNNVPTLIECRIKETHTETNDQYEETTYKQIRKLQLIVLGAPEDEGGEGESLSVMTTIYRQMGDTDNTWEVVFADAIPLNRIPLSVFYANQTGAYQGEPFFDDLAWLNLQHWQSTSDQNNILHYVRVPRFYGYGFSKEEVEKLEEHGIASFVYSTKKPDEVKSGWIEAKGDSIKQGADSIKDLERTLEAQSLEPLVTQATVDITATKTKQDAEKSNSIISFWARNLSTTVEDMLNVANLFLGNPENRHSVKVNDDFDLIQDTDKKAKEIREWRGARLISHETALEAGKGLSDFLPKDMDILEEVLKVQQELPIE